MKRKQNPINQIISDLQKLAELAVTGSIHAPDFHQQMIKKKATAILSKYVVTRKRINGVIKRAGLKSSTKPKYGDADYQIPGKPPGYNKYNQHPDFD